MESQAGRQIGMDPKQAFLLMTTSDSSETVTRAKTLARFAPCHVAYESVCDLSFPDDTSTWDFSVTDFPFKIIGSRVVPGSTIYAAMIFLLESNYDYIWFIEDDAFIKGGDWQRLLDFVSLDYDFIGIEIADVGEHWMWTKNFEVPEGLSTHEMRHLNVLCSVCRISRSAAFVVTSMLRLGFAGHHEMVVPTLIHHCGLKMTDLTALGMVDQSTFRHLPPLSPDELHSIPEGMLVHPCKDRGDADRVGDDFSERLTHPSNPASKVPKGIKDIFAPLGGLPYSCSHAEYHYLGQLIRAWAPIRLLVFGVGRDVRAWTEVNSHGGTCLFLENDLQWFERARREVPEANIKEITYSSDFAEWADQGYQLGNHLIPEVAGFEFSQKWDVAFVDSPLGATFGRQQSAFLATKVLRHGGLLAIHDCERNWEQEICRRIIEPSGFSLYEEVERLRVYKKCIS
jgi:hypothetical protein